MSVEMALEQWAQALGAQNVVSDDATRAQYGRTTQDEAAQPSCILYPTSTEQVQAVVQIADAHGIHLYPISRGKNWGYGDACALQPGAAIVDLSRMNRILEVNTELAYAVIEPGVSQEQLYRYLRENKTGLWLDCTGAGHDSSLLGNTLDRGFGHTRYGDHFLSACGLEVVLADGRVLDTGFGHFEHAKSKHVYRYGVGPFLDGIFCQSNLGIVTKLGLWLMPEPEAFTFFFIRCDTPEGLGPIVDRLRPLRMQGVLQSAVHIGNDLRILSGTGRYPWKEAGGETPLPDAVRARMRRASGVGAWNVGGSLTGTAAQVRAGRKALRKAARGVGKLTFVDDRLLAIGEAVSAVLNRLGMGKGLQSRLDALKPNYGLLKGIPTDEPLLGAQWRLRHPPSGEVTNPLDHGCGLFWISPVLPMTGRDAKALLAITEPIFTEFGFEQLATFTLITERAMIGILNVAFDKAVEEETRRAVACYDALFAAVMQAGYVPYRVGLRGVPKLYAQRDVFWDVALQLKNALDPRGLIAPGRYIPLQDRE